jgi:2-deoxy-D-gluconate 3-dehydrogenase
MAAALARAGADIAGVSASLEPQGSGIQREVEEAGRRFKGYACDLSDREALYQFVRQVTQDFSVIDVLVNNAGTILRRPAADHPDEFWDKVIETNLTSGFILSREIGKLMVARGKGKIIFVASVLSFQGGITVPGYAASKGGVAQLTKALANEWASKGVNVNAIAPGYIETDNAAPLKQDPQRNAAILARIPAGRWGIATDLQGATVFLASAASDYVHGSILTVDGGWMGR